MGKNYVNGKTFLEKRYDDKIELEDAVHNAILTLKEGFEGEVRTETAFVLVGGFLDPLISLFRPKLPIFYVEKVMLPLLEGPVIIEKKEKKPTD